MGDQLVIFGAGSHARKVYHYAIGLGWIVPVFVDEDPGARAPVAGTRVVAPADLGNPAPGSHMFVAIGQAAARRSLMQRYSSLGWALPALIHRTAWVAPDAVVGEGALVAAGAIVETGSIVGRGAIVDVGAVVDHDSRVGDFAHVRPGDVLLPRSNVAGPADGEP